jgi:hypothetical protein
MQPRYTHSRIQTRDLQGTRANKQFSLMPRIMRTLAVRRKQQVCLQIIQQT